MLLTSSYVMVWTPYMHSSSRVAWILIWATFLTNFPFDIHATGRTGKHFTAPSQDTSENVVQRLPAIQYLRYCNLQCNRQLLTKSLALSLMANFFPIDNERRQKGTFGDLGLIIWCILQRTYFYHFCPILDTLGPSIIKQENFCTYDLSALVHVRDALQ